MFLSIMALYIQLNLFRKSLSPIACNRRFASFHNYLPVNIGFRFSNMADRASI
jgi:hypothetical protein